MADDNTRRPERLELLGSLGAEVMVFQPMRIHQISTGGMPIETGFPIHLNSLHDFRLSLGERSIVVKGRVAHSRISDVDQDMVTYRSGIEFIEPSDGVAEVIAEFIESLKQDRQNA